MQIVQIVQTVYYNNANCANILQIVGNLRCSRSYTDSAIRSSVRGRIEQLQSKLNTVLNTHFEAELVASCGRRRLSCATTFVSTAAASKERRCSSSAEARARAAFMQQL